MAADKVSRVVTVTLIALLVIGVFCFGMCMRANGATPVCGAPQPVFGRVMLSTEGDQPNAGATVQIAVLSDQPVPIATTRTNPFGWYRFNDMLPCVDYVVLVQSKRAWYQPLAFTLQGWLANGQRIDLFGEPQ